MHPSKPRLAVLKSLASFVLATTTLLVAGCGIVDGVSLNGGVFDYLGVSDKSNEGRGGEPRLQDRGGLVLPPDARRLPQPGSGEAQQRVAIGDPSWPADEDARRRAGGSAREKAHQEFCSKELTRKRIAKDLTPTDGPMGPCDASALRNIGMDPNASLQRLPEGAEPKRGF